MVRTPVDPAILPLAGEDRFGAGVQCLSAVTTLPTPPERNRFPFRA